MMAKQLITERVLKEAEERARSGDYCDCYTIRERNLTLSMVLLARVSEILSLSLFSFYMLEIAQDFAVNAISLGLIFSIQVVFTGIGGLVFGILGDYFGRKRTLMMILTVSSIGSAITVFSPNIAILVAARAIVGLGCGGEWGIGMSMLNEICHKKVRGLVSGLIQGAYPLGMTIAAFLPMIVPDSPYPQWRIGFAALIAPALLVVPVKVWMRESQMWLDFRLLKSHHRLPEEIAEVSGRFTFLQLWEKDLVKRTVLGLFLTTLGQLGFYTVWSWAPAYLQMEKGESFVAVANIVGIAWLVIGWPGHLLGGAISDRIGRRSAFTIWGIGYVASVLLLVRAGTLWEIFVSVAMNVFFAGYFGVYGALYGELFPTRVRATALNFLYNVGRALAFPAPVLMGYFASISRWDIGLYLGAGLSLISAVIIVWALPELKARRLEM